MRVLFALLALLCLSTVEASADGSWCAYYGSGHGGTNCGFYSFEQCMAALSGNGGYCARNQFYSSRRDTRGRE